ncbi:MAG: serpin family protein [Tannerella sp.]|jgi:serpin B|nr:serpin family protein [Tannerella sp.]
MKKVVLCMICVSIGLYACQSEGLAIKEDLPEQPSPTDDVASAKPREDILLTKAEEAVLHGNNVFAFNLLKEVFENEGKESNIFISPLSATLALAMLNNGAVGVTQEQIQTALGYGGQTREDVNSYFRKMVNAMHELDEYVRFESANSIWISNLFPVLSPFKEVNQTYFEAEVRNVDYSDPATLGLINGWIAEKTHDLIPDFFSRLDPDTRMALINALYFKGSWTRPFDSENTKDAPFYNANGATQNVAMMDFGKEVRLNYLQEDAFELVELPYGNEAFCMTLLLPRKDVSLASIIENLNAAAWDDCLSKLHLNTVIVRLPRFKIEYTRPLNDDLKALGMTSMFMFGNADFSLISNESSVVSSVSQKTFIEVNEEGTEAAAVTGIIVGTAFPDLPVQPPVLEFNRPFVYFIKEKSTGSVFFAGVMRNL